MNSLFRSFIKLLLFEISTCLSFRNKYGSIKLTKFSNTCAIEGAQAGNDFREMGLFSKKKNLGNKFREVFQLEIVELIIYRPHFHRKCCAFKKIPKTLETSEILKIFILQRWWNCLSTTHHEKQVFCSRNYNLLLKNDHSQWTKVSELVPVP